MFGGVCTLFAIILFTSLPSYIAPPSHNISPPTHTIFPPLHENYAYAIFLQVDGNPGNWAEAATLVYNLKSLGNQYPIEVILTSELDESVQGFQTCLVALGAKTVALKPAIMVPGQISQYEKTYTKLLFWKMTEYEIVFVMDTEQLLVPDHKMDDMFKVAVKMFREGNELLGVDHGKCRQDAKQLVSSGFMLLRPNHTLFEEIMESVQKYGNGTTEQEFLQQFFEKRGTIGILDYGWGAHEWYHDSWKLFGKEDYFWNGVDSPPKKLYSIQEKKSLFPQKGIQQYYQSRWDLAKQSLKNQKVNHLCLQMYHSNLR